MVTEKDLMDEASKYVKGIQSPSSILSEYCCLLDAVKRKYPLWLAIYYNHGLDLGLDESDCKEVVSGIENENDVFENLKIDLEMWCKPSWENKLDQLININ